MLVTEKLYLVNQYLKECDAVVKSAHGNELVLDQTVFYPTGGGQPNDTGAIRIGDATYAVTDARRDGEHVVHVVDGEVKAAAGGGAHCAIDWDRRYSLMRHHTAVHLIDAVFVNRYRSGKITGGQLYTDRARFDVDFDGFDKALAESVLEEATLLAGEGHEVKSYLVTKAEAAKIPQLARTAPGRELLERLEVVRVVEIAGIDMQADGGLHVRDTREIGRMNLLKYTNNGRHHKRIEIQLSI